jgi:hypothetical protein
MQPLDFIKIRGLETLPTEEEPPEEEGEGEGEGEGEEQPAEDPYLFFEVFQGLSGGSGGPNETPGIVTPPATPISEDSEVAEALWKAQNGCIEEENAHLDEINEMLLKKKAEMPENEGVIGQVLEEWIEEVVSIVIGILTWAFTESLMLAKIAMFVSGSLVGIAIEYLRKLYDRSTKMCTALKDENAALLTLEMTRENYELRNAVMLTHTEKIENMLLLVNRMEAQIEKVMDMDMKDLIESVRTLKYNDEAIELGGGVKIYNQSKVVEL